MVSDLGGGGHLARMLDNNVLTKLLLESLELGDCSEDPGIYGRIILKCILRSEVGGSGVAWRAVVSNRGVL